MPQEYKGFTCPSYDDSADMHQAFVDYTDDMVSKSPVYAPGGVAPENPSVGQIWFDQVTEFGTHSVVWNGTEWEEVCGCGPTEAPYNWAEGGKVHYYQDGEVWYRVHTVKSSTDFKVVRNGKPFRALVVAGGGGGQQVQDDDNAGGGAGGVIQDDNLLLDVKTYPVVIGNGGAINTNGGNTTFHTFTAVGGGKGGGGNGGCGGGQAINTSAGTGVAGQGFAGGAGGHENPGGGGGAGVVGTYGADWFGGDGGNGIESNITGAKVWYGGGGAGSGLKDAADRTDGLGTTAPPRPPDAHRTSPWAIGGKGGGGGLQAKNGAISKGVDGLGGGGGASWSNNAGAGGKGVLIVSYEVAGPEFNEATGGTVTKFSKDGKFYARHTFLSSADITVVKNPNPFTVYLLGGGGGGGKNGFDGGGPHGGGKGGGGGYFETDVYLGLTSYPIVVGAAGAAGTSYSGGEGGDSTAFAYKAGGGGYGAWGQDAITGGDGRPGIPTPAANGGNGAGNNHPQTSPVTGKQAPIGLAVTVGEGGPGGAADGNMNVSNPGTAGKAGAVVVEYEIAAPPFNEATGGTVTEATIGGKRYRLHTFTTSGSLIVTNAPQPFTYSVQAGGAGGGYGTGGGRGEHLTGEVTLTVGAIPITVGAAVSGGYNEVTNRDGPGNNGNPSKIGTLVTAAAGISRGAIVAAGATTNITGTTIQYGGSGGACNINQNTNSGGFPGGGVGGSTGTDATWPGGGGGGCQWTSGGGARGEVIIRYEIAP